MPVFTVGSGGVPVGNYTATFQGVEAQPANKERGYGEGLLDVFHACEHIGGAAAALFGEGPRRRRDRRAGSGRGC